MRRQSIGAVGATASRLLMTAPLVAMKTTTYETSAR
jgi:hypothetical protein